MKCVSENRSLEILTHTTPLTWVFNLIKCDYDLKITGINFLNLADIKYEPDTMTPAAYFQKVKALIMANTARAGQVIQHNNNVSQMVDKTFGPCFQDYILYNTIRHWPKTHQAHPESLQTISCCWTETNWLKIWHLLKCSKILGRIFSNKSL